MRDGVCVSLQQLEEAVERAEAALPLKEFFGGFPAGLREVEGLESFAKCLGERMCVGRV